MRTALRIATSNLLTSSLNNDTTVAQLHSLPRPCLRCAVSNDPSEHPEPPRPQNRHEGPAREIDSQELMQGSREIVIRHGTEAYRLSVTRSGKLILRK